MTASDTILAAIIAGTVALIVAVISQSVAVANQVLTHRLAQRRETQKYYNEVYQKLFIPTVPDLFLFIDMVSNYHRRHDTTLDQEIEVKDRILSHVANNLIYASPKLVLDYQRIHSHRISDQSAINPSKPEIYFLFAFISEYSYVLQKSSIYVDNQARQQIEAISRYRILYLLLCKDMECIVPLNFYFSKERLTSKNYTKVMKIVEKSERYDEQVWEESQIAERQAEKMILASSQDKHVELFNQMSSKQYEIRRQKWSNNKIKTIKHILNVLIASKYDRDQVFQEIIATTDMEQYGFGEFWKPDNLEWLDSAPDVPLANQDPEDGALG